MLEAEEEMQDSSLCLRQQFFLIKKSVKSVCMCCHRKNTAYRYAWRLLWLQLWGRL